MKKEFMEPEMKRIELNLKENIANSNEGLVSGSYRTTQNGTDPCYGVYIDSGLATSNGAQSDGTSDFQYYFQTLGATDPRITLFVENCMGPSAQGQAISYMNSAI